MTPAMSATPLRFSKMHGLGNDFAVFDAIHQTVNLSPEQIRQLADRHRGIGFDQLLLVERSHSDHADFRYRIFNADGGEVAQCGNGARCFARFVREHGLSERRELRVETQNGLLLLIIEDNERITVNMGVPRHHPRDIPLCADAEAPEYTVEVAETIYHFGAVSLGNPHAVLTVADVATAPVTSLGAVLTTHFMFPEQANIGFMQIINRTHLRLRVYERGSGETLACGSGACAAAVIGIERGALDECVRVTLPGGELEVRWAGRGQPVWMTGPATTVFDGTIVL